MGNITDELDGLPEEAIQDSLWQIGLNIHRFSEQERVDFIRFINCKADVFSSNTILRSLGYVTHVYFASMSDIEKEIFLNTLVNLCDKEEENLWGDLFDMLGIVFKVAPQPMRPDLLDLILDKTVVCHSDPSAVISLCNAFRFIFLEVDSSGRIRILTALRELKHSNKIDYLADSIAHTIYALERLRE